MNNQNPNRVSRGVPTGGQFAARQRAEADITLDLGVQVPDHDLWGRDEDGQFAAVERDEAPVDLTGGSYQPYAPPAAPAPDAPSPADRAAATAYHSDMRARAERAAIIDAQRASDGGNFLRAVGTAFGPGGKEAREAVRDQSRQDLAAIRTLRDASFDVAAVTPGWADMDRDQRNDVRAHYASLIVHGVIGIDGVPRQPLVHDGGRWVPRG